MKTSWSLYIHVEQVFPVMELPVEGEDEFLKRRRVANGIEVKVWVGGGGCSRWW